MVKVDIHNREKNLERNTAKYISRLFQDDQEDVRRFINDHLANGYSFGRVDKYLTSLVSIRRMLNKPFKTATQDECKAFVAGLTKSKYAPWSQHDFKVILRLYLRWLKRDDVISWLKIQPVKSGKLPEEILTEDDVKKLAEAAYTSRDRAFILCLYESGGRIGEILPLQLKNVSFDKNGAVFRVTGKTGDRRIRLIASSLTLQVWLKDHPEKNNSEAYLWCKIPAPNNPKTADSPLSYGFIGRLLRELAEKAGIKKSVNPHAFRHARATFLSTKLKEPVMREMFGWSNSSEMVSNYVHLSGRDVDDSLLAIYGKAEAKKNNEPIIREWSCPRCQEANEPATKYCKKCGLPVDAGNMDKLEGLLVDFLKIIGDEFPQVREKFREVVKERGAEGIIRP